MKVDIAWCDNWLTPWRRRSQVVGSSARDRDFDCTSPQAPAVLLLVHWFVGDHRLSWLEAAWNRWKKAFKTRIRFLNTLKTRLLSCVVPYLLFVLIWYLRRRNEIKNIFYFSIHCQKKKLLYFGKDLTNVLIFPFLHYLIFHSPKNVSTSITLAHIKAPACFWDLLAHIMSHILPLNIDIFRKSAFVNK